MDAENSDLFAIFESSPVGVSVARRSDGKVVYANSRFAEMLGVPLDGFIGTFARDWFGDPLQYGAVISRLKHHGRIDSYDVEFRRPDGSLFWVIFSILPAQWNGEAVNLAWIFDIRERKETERQLKEKQTLIGAILDASTDSIALFGLDGHLYEVNAALATLVGREQSEMEGRPLAEALPSPLAVRFRALAADIASHRRPQHSHSDLEGKNFDHRAYPVFDGSGRLEKVAVFTRDVTEERRRNAELRKLSTAVAQAPVTVLITDAEGDIEYVNQNFSQVTGYKADEVLGRNPRILSSGLVAADTYKDLWATITSGRTWQGELCNRNKDGSLIWEFAVISPVKDEHERISHYLAVKEDITLRKEYEEKLIHQANHDHLTGLPNHFLAMDRLEYALAAAKRADRTVVVMLAILDDINKLNTTLGYKAGDAALVEFSARIKRSVRDADTVARIGGNEFMVVISNIEAPAVAEVLANRILDECRRPYVIDDREVLLTARIGMSAFPSDSPDPLILVRNARAAAYRSEERGMNSFRFFTPKMNLEAQARLKIESNLHHAVERGELAIHYQPIIETGSRRIIGAEALLRWTHPELGPVSPDRFIPVAEATDLILPISRWVMDEACQQAARWRRINPAFKLAVNFSPRQFKRIDLVEETIALLESAGLPPESLEVEVTERLLMGDNANAKLILDTMKTLGISISIDDFGTGYSSLAYLQHFRFDTLKVDKSFVKDIAISPNARSLVAAIVEMARALGMSVIAEGVEDEAQEMILSGLSCAAMQGFLFARPMPPASFDLLIAESSATGTSP